MHKHKRCITFPIDEIGAAKLNDWWASTGEGIATTELPEEEFDKLEFDIFGWAFDEFDIDIDEYEDDVIPYENIDAFLSKIAELGLEVPVFVNALQTAKKFKSIVYCSC